MPRILRTRTCDADLLEISAYIGSDNPIAADALIDTFHEKFLMLADSVRANASCLSSSG